MLAGSPGTGTGSNPPQRRRDIDLLRMLVVVGLVFFHAARVFDVFPFYVKNDPSSDALTAVIAFASLWGMPLLFLIAGIGIGYSLRGRSIGEFAAERIRRLLVPLVFGVLVIVPPQVWTRLRTAPGYDASYWQFLGDFFDVRFTPTAFPFLIGADPATGLFEPAHLWFVVVLLAFSLLLLPVIRWLQTEPARRLIDWLGARAGRAWMLVVAALPLAVLEAGLGSEQGLAGWNRYAYAVFLLYGYLVSVDPRFGSALRRHRYIALFLGLLTFVALGIVFGAMQDRGVDLMRAADPVSVATRALKASSGWLWVVAIVGFAAGVGQGSVATARRTRWRAMSERLVAYMAEAVLPVYVLHQTVIVLVAAHVVRWPVAPATKYLVICLSSFVFIFLIYDLAVRRHAPMRWLFGMKPRRH